MTIAIRQHAEDEEGLPNSGAQFAFTVAPLDGSLALGFACNGNYFGSSALTEPGMADIGVGVQLVRDASFSGQEEMRAWVHPCGPGEGTNFGATYDHGPPVSEFMEITGVEMAPVILAKMGNYNGPGPVDLGSYSGLDGARDLIVIVCVTGPTVVAPAGWTQFINTTDHDPGFMVMAQIFSPAPTSIADLVLAATGGWGAIIAGYYSTSEGYGTSGSGAGSQIVIV